MKSRAAVAFGPGKPLEIVEIDVAEPKAKEVLVKMNQLRCSGALGALRIADVAK